MEKAITITLSIFGGLAVIGGWIFSLGVLWQRQTDLTTRIKKIEDEETSASTRLDTHLRDTAIHRDPARDDKELNLLRQEVHSIREDIKNLPDRFLALFQSLNSTK